MVNGGLIGLTATNHPRSSMSHSRLVRRSAYFASSLLAVVLVPVGVGAISPSSVIQSCVDRTTGTVRIVTLSTACTTGERYLLWNQLGPEGEAGARGARGVTGNQGPTGARGARGVTGNQGPTGATGDKGAQGARGMTGPEGTTGAIGPNGEIGAQGAAGAPGPQGDTGAAGAAGAQGEIGAQGAAGAPGPQGDTGAAGAAGPMGETGAVGAAGADGATGPQGETGAAGTTGPQGEQGAQGESGASAMTVVTKHVDIGSGRPESVEVVCPEGFMPISGAYLFEGEAAPVIGSYPERGSWWFVLDGQDLREGTRATLQAICLDGVTLTDKG